MYRNWKSSLMSKQDSAAHFLEKFDNIVTQYPDNIAVLTDGQDTLSYAELKDRALRVANALKQAGATKETLVGLHIEKSSEYLISMLGCWYAGAAFMPLDPDLPDERRKYILADSKVALVLSREKAAEKLKGEVSDLINIENALQVSPLHTPDIGTINGLAYVIYTSGSTGNPKGVEVTHTGLVSMLNAQIDAFQLDQNSRSLFYLSTNFDASVSDIGTAFLSGASLCIENISAQEIATSLRRIISDRGITYVDIPPSMLRILDPDNAPSTLKSVTIGGEALDPEIARKWADKVRLVNVYGPTEATICTSLCIIDPENWNQPTIGNALPGVDYKVVNEDLSETKIGDSGELLIGGIQLARGYLGKPELNSEKFISIDGQRYYRSGDLITVGPNHDLVFQGRIDRQVKMRGQLVELEEVEAKILKDPSIAQAAVVKREIHGRDALVAFIKPKGQFDETRIQQRLAASLSSWMIPSHFEEISDMPLTTTGKIDLTQLKNWDITSTIADVDQSQISMSDTEEKISAIWQKILKHSNFGLDDSFFDVGGDSLAQVELALAAEMVGLPITPNLVNEKKTIRSIAEHLDLHDDIDADMDFITSDVIKADDLRAQMLLDQEWENLIAHARTLPSADANTPPQNIFMTGANGFLASRLIHELLTHSGDTKIYALVRATDPENGMKRIESALENHGLKLTNQMKARIHPVCGDLAKPFMGMDQDEWHGLSETIDTVMHSGAIVNMTASYDKLYGANVQGTKEATKFALSGRRKKMHYASTLSVFVSTDQNEGELLESDRLENTQLVYGGYGQTKWAAEYFLHQIPSDVCDISIHRLGLITGDTLTGKSSPKDFLNMFVHGIIQLGAVPDTPSNHIEVDATPIDYSAEVLRHIMLNEEVDQDGKHKVYHIANTAGFSLDQILNEIRWRGNQIDTLPACVWTDKMARMQEGGFSTQEAAAYFGISRTLPRDDVLSRHTAMDLFQATGVKFHQENTQKVLKGSGIVLPLPDNRLLSTYIDSITGKKRSISAKGVQRAMGKKTGMILGKFYPFHSGHEYLIDFASKYPGVDQLYVVVDRTPNPSIPQAKRVKWIQDTFKDRNVTVLPLGDYNYQDPSEAPDRQTFWDQWERSLKELIPESVDYVFNSEDYGWKLAEVMGARHVPVDQGRENFPISGTDMRKDPLANWHFMPATVRPYYLRKVVIVGAESTGKSTLAANLAKSFNTVMVPEYARTFLENLARKEEARPTNYDDLELFANGQRASEDTLTTMANRVLICDTDAITTKIWSETLYPDQPVPSLVQEMANEEGRYDFYVLANPDVAWEPDVHRQWEDESKQERRIAFNAKVKADLESRGLPYIEITGDDYDDRFIQAREAIIRHVYKGRTFSDFNM